MKFCPKCGTPRAANFCSRCGYSFLDVEAEMVAADKGWFSDPKIKGLERYWDGTAWTAKVRSIPEIPEGMAPPLVAAASTKASAVKLKLKKTALTYGEGYDESTHCMNCGQPRRKTDSVCKLCEFEF